MRIQPLTWSIVCFLALLILLQRCEHNPTEPDRGKIVSKVIDQTDIDSLSLSVQVLSGEQMVMIRDTMRVIASRHRRQPGNDLAAEYIGMRLRSFGLHPEDSRFGSVGRSVYAVQTGTRSPRQAYMICAHYDSYPPGDLAPGADDNASGTAAVLEAARLLSEYETNFTLIYAFWDEEEQGLRGSRAFAAQLHDSTMAILGVINLDMIGWDSDDDGTVLVDRDELQQSIDLEETVASVNQRYQIGLLPRTTHSFGRSDHASFWAHGIGAIMIIEHYGQDWNKNYHTRSDRFASLNMNFYRKTAKLAIGTVATLVVLN